ncbi:hypothetical protein ACW73L_07370 [Methylolobus aquaticus]
MSAIWKLAGIVVMVVYLLASLAADRWGWTRVCLSLCLLPLALAVFWVPA